MKSSPSGIQLGLMAVIVDCRANYRMNYNIKPGRYQHFKGGQYLVLGVACDSESAQPEWVVYRALYGDHGLWVRPLSMFCETVERNGIVRPRFEWIGD